ncbi:MAG TPA: PaaI family thioesterase [Candidatus Dormibacteraeota bacterium]|nr:PaaI family thioesterase [Candidatus Dormibacteraeota bacterium]
MVNRKTLPSLEHLPPFLAALGMEFETVEPSRVVAWIELGPDQHTPWGVVHGGAYTTAIESAASVGASAAVLERSQFAVGVNNITDFIRPMVKGRVRVVAEPIHQGASQQLWEVNITRADDGKLVARGQVRLQNVDLPS